MKFSRRKKCPSHNHPSRSKNNSGVITNRRFATLAGLQLVPDSDSHNEEIPAKSIQFVTNNASSNCSCSRPHQRFSYFSEKHEVSSLNCIGFTGRLSIAPDQSLSHFSQWHLVPPLRCIGFTGRLSIIHDFTGMNDTNHSKFHLRRKQQIRNSNITADLDT